MTLACLDDYPKNYLVKLNSGSAVLGQVKHGVL